MTDINNLSDDTRFDCFLNYRGIKRETSLSQSSEDYELISQHSGSALQASGLMDHLSIGQDLYLTVKKNGDRRYSNNTTRVQVFNKDLVDTHARLPRNSQSAYLQWEQHDYDASEDTEKDNGIKDNFHPDLTAIDSSDPCILVRRAPGTRFRDSLELVSLPIRKLQMENARRYKNNLTCIISGALNVVNDADELSYRPVHSDPQNCMSTASEDYLVSASNDEVVIFAFDNTTHLPCATPVLRFDTRPPFTSSTERIISTWPHFPHTINFLRSSTFLGQNVLGACSDDGTLRIWHTNTILKCIKSKTENTNIGKVNADFTLRLPSSVWGLDFLTYRDSKGNTHNILVASDNSQTVTLFYYHVTDCRFYHVQSCELSHNIPEVSFIGGEELNGTHCIQVAAASIAGEILSLEIRFDFIEGPLNKDDYDYFRMQKVHYVYPSMVTYDRSEYEERYACKFQRVSFSDPSITASAVLNEDCWTVKPVSSSDFKQVVSISAVFGDSSIDEEQEITHIINESTILDLLFDPVETSHLGLAASWQFFECIVTSFTPHHNPLESAKFTTAREEYERILHCFQGTARKLKDRKRVESTNGNTYRLRSEDLVPTKFLFVSTSKKLGLFGTNLVCNSATRRLFDLAIPFNEDSKYSNRISISQVIPQLQCVVVVSQQGLCSILRLCASRGVYGFRQEHIFPNALSLALGRSGFRTIVGLSIRDKSPGVMLPRFFIYILYSDGVFLGYEATLKDGELVVVDV